MKTLVGGNNATGRVAHRTTSLLSSPSSLFLYFVFGSVLVCSDVVTTAAAAADVSTSDEVSFLDTTKISYVIEPFEAMGTVDGTTPWTWIHPDATFTLISSDENKLHGNHSVMIEYDDDTAVDFGWIQSDRPHNCFGADEIALWVKVLRGSEVDSSGPPSSSRTNMTVTLYNDLQCTLSSETGTSGALDCSLAENLESFDIMEQTFDLREGTNQWVELRFPVSSFPPSFDIRRIRGWKIRLAGKGMMIVDQLACLGDGHKMMGAAFAHPFQDMDLAVQEKSWTEEYYESERSANYTTRSLRIEKDSEGDTEFGVLSLRYMVEQKETWGGYSDWAHFAPGNSYYNLSGATDIMLSYNVTAAANVTGRTIMRLILLESSHCVEGCGNDKQYPNERWYSFHSILDEVGHGQLLVPLQGSTDSTDGLPFWLTGWAGIIGNSELNIEYIKGFDIELSLDSELEIGQVVTGAIEISQLKAATRDAVDDDNGGSEPNDVLNDEAKCVVEEGLYVNEAYEGFYKTVQFLGPVCCDVCMEDPDCLYAVANSQDCFLAKALEPETISIANNTIQVEFVTVYWMDDEAKRGDFCDMCECLPEEEKIDCRGKDLVVVPKTFSAREDGWKPKIVDLTENPSLVMIGKGALSAIAKNIVVLALPANLKHLSPSVLEDLPALKHLDFESDEERGIVNAIFDISDSYGDVCCGLGKEVIVNDGTPTGQVTVTFCDMQISQPGIDSTYEPFIFHLEPAIIEEITPSSPFMAEAAESVEKCAEYCTVVEDCNFFSYDQRLPNAEHVCGLLSDKGPKSERVCCNELHYADENQTIPGHIAGRPPRTRHRLDNAKVMFSQNRLQLNPGNEYQTSYDVWLGSTPLRGAVWVEPVVAGQQDKSVVLTISPRRVVLYSANQTATIHISGANIDGNSQEGSLLIRNRISSCDEAYSAFPDADENDIFVTLTAPDEDDQSVKLAVAIAVPIASVLLIALCVFFFYEHKRKENEALWKVDEKDIRYADPPEIIGRGTFGLVVLGEYRGTQVAVKRVIPPRNQYNTKSSVATSAFDHVSQSESERAGSDRSRANRLDMAGVVSSKTDSLGGDTGSSSSLQKEQDETGITMSTSKVNFGHDSSIQRKNLQVSSWAQLRVPGLSGSLTMEQNTKKKSKVSKSKRRNSMSEANWKQNRNEFVQEMVILSKLRHPNVTTVMGAVIGHNIEPLLIMEYMQHGSLYDILHNETMVVDGELLLPILRDISQGVRFLHAANPQVIHGDLKAQNILVDSRFRAKVADFGLSNRRTLGGTGTPYWMAPELLRCECRNNDRTDVYSFGIILYEVYSRKDPYEGEDPNEVLRLVADKAVSKRPGIPPGCPSHVQSLMNDCLVDSAERRPLFDEIDTRLKRIDSKEANPTSIAGGGSLFENRQQQHKSSISLFDIFPAHIAQALQEGRAVEAERKECVTIFFSDIIGFTRLAAVMDPRKVADLMGRLYGKFDALTVQYDVFKVETVGDAYMATTNLVKDQESDHTKRIAEFAIAAVKAANETLIDVENKKMGYVNIRVGFHSGPVVADVVGARNPRYCLFGDTVNTASRMESNSRANRIHCSSTSAELLMEQFPTLSLKSRGMVPIKGKGEMHTYWVNNDRMMSDEDLIIDGTTPPPGVHQSGRDVEEGNFRPTMIPSAPSGRLLVSCDEEDHSHQYQSEEYTVDLKESV